MYGGSDKQKRVVSVMRKSACGEQSLAVRSCCMNRFVWAVGLDARAYAQGLKCPRENARRERKN
jgi:hypothetical protein